MIKKSFFSWLFLVFFISLSYAHSQKLEDMDLAPRLLLLSVFNIICLASLFVTIKNNTSLVFYACKTPIFVSAVIFVLTLYAGYFNSINKGDALFEVLKITAAFTFLLIIVVLLITKKIDLATISTACLVATGITLVYTIWNIYTEYQYAQIKKESFSITYAIFGNHCNKNTLAEFLLLTLPFNMLLFLNKKKILKIITAITITGSVLLIIILKSASVLIGLVMIVLTTAIILVIKKYRLTKKQIWLCNTVALTLLLVTCFTNNTIFKRISLAYHYTLGYNDSLPVNNNNSTFERLMMWRNSFLMIKEEPLTGIGLANWKILFPKYGYTGAKYLAGDTIKFTRPHNDYLQFWSENGLICIASFIAIFLFALIVCIQRLRYSNKEDTTITFLICFCGLLSYSVVCFFGYTTERPYNLILLMLYVAVIISTSPVKNQTANAKSIIVTLMLLLICANIYASSIFGARVKNELLLHMTLSGQKLKSYKVMLSNAEKIDAENFPISYTATPINWYKATACFLNNKPQTAKEFYLKAVKQAPYHVQVISDAGVMMEQNGNITEAENYYNRALSINKDFPQAKLNLSALKYKQKKITEAYNALRNFASKSLLKSHYEQMVTFKKTFLVMLADSALDKMKQTGQTIPSKEKIFYEDLLKADSIAEKEGTEITDNLIKVFSSIK